MDSDGVLTSSAPRLSFPRFSASNDKQHVYLTHPGLDRGWEPSHDGGAAVDEHSKFGASTRLPTAMPRRAAGTSPPLHKRPMITLIDAFSNFGSLGSYRGLRQKVERVVADEGLSARILAAVEEENNPLATALEAKRMKRLHATQTESWHAHDDAAELDAENGDPRAEAKLSPRSADEPARTKRSIPSAATLPTVHHRHPPHTEITVRGE